MSTLKESQQKRFTEQIEEIIPNGNYNLKSEFNDDPILTSAKLNTDEKLNHTQLNQLLYTGDAWNSEIEISRSGAGLKITFETTYKTT